jgi:hypothetical protein
MGRPFSRRSFDLRWESPVLSGDERSTFYISLLLYALLLLPILIADRYNIDDWGRSVFGYLHWANNGRPLTDLIVRTLDLGTPLADFSPTCQIGSIICLAWLSAVVARKFAIRRPFLASLATFPLGANPFFLANLSFKFDSLPMALSLLFALIPVVLDTLSAERESRSMLLGSIFLLGSLCLYQPGINAFLIFAVLEYLLLQKTNESPATITRLVRHRIIQFVLALCLYKIVALCTVREGYSTEHSSLVHGIQGLAIVQRNLVVFWSFPIVQLTGRLRVALLLPIVFALLISIAVGWRYSSQAFQRGKFIWVSSAFLTPVLMLLGTFGFLILLQSPAGGPRTFIGFGALLASSLVIISSVLTDYNVPGSLQCGFLIVPAYMMIAFAAIFGNATKAQKDYERHIAEKLSDDLKEVMSAEPISNLIVEGSVGYAPVVKRIVEKRYSLLGNLVPIDLASDEDGGFAHMVLGYQGISVPPETSKDRRSAITAESEHSIPFRRNSYYRLFLVDHELVVRLGNY